MSEEKEKTEEIIEKILKKSQVFGKTPKHLFVKLLPILLELPKEKNVKVNMVFIFDKATEITVGLVVEIYKDETLIQTYYLGETIGSEIIEE